MAEAGAYPYTQAPAGTGLYYASLFIDSSRRSRLLALYALEDELQRSLSVQDPGVARLRLQWWREEIQQARAATARHPITRELQPLLQDGRLDGGLLLEAIRGIEAELVATDSDTFEAIVSQYRRHFGPVWQLSTALCDINDNTALDAAAQLGGLHHLNLALQALPRNLDRGFCRPIPRRELEASGLQPERPPGNDSSRWRHLLNDQFQRLQTCLEQAIDEFPATAAVQATHCLILARLDAALCTEIRRDGCRIFRQQYALTPLRKLWLAWRTYRRVMSRAR